ncbi:hypothetical protein CPLU01_08270 [Colletotrichum plurivorum]|uniref:Clr5 domain-containing protein n=1 Tax=Colletotrichum plurivorum TaxID=2175906 RepID=A0A8H6KCC9_9PEZI|nr:hypothetical protein CPLU01_08270 [Colletotrichum plurivorum]
MAPRQKRAVIDDADWERVRPVIYRLYIKESKSRKDILVTLGASHDFHPSKAQLAWKLKQWHMVRNLASSEWKFVVERINLLQQTPGNFNLPTQCLPEKISQLALGSETFSTLAYTTKLQYTYQTLSLLMPEHPWGNHVVIAEGLLKQSSYDCNSAPLEGVAYLLCNNFLQRQDNQFVSDVPTDLIERVLGILQHTTLTALRVRQHYSKLPFSIQALLERLFKEVVQRSNLGAVKWLLQAGVDVNLPLNGMLFENQFALWGTVTPFEYAAIIYDIPLTELLIEPGADCRIHNLRTIFYPRGRRLRPDTEWLASIELMLSKYEFRSVDEKYARHLLNEISSIGRCCLSDIVIGFLRGKLKSETAICQLLITAIRTHSPMTMELLAEHIDHINAISTFKETPLNAAVSEENMDVCAHLLRLGASLRPYPEGSDKLAAATPLQCAAYFTNAAMMRQLLDAGADPNDCHRTDPEPQHLKCIMGPLQQKYWFEEFTITTGSIGRTVLQAALMGGKIDNVLLLLREGARLIGGELAIAILNRQSSIIGHLVDAKSSFVDAPVSAKIISILEASIVMGDLRLVQDIVKANPKAITPVSLSAAVWQAKATSNLTIVKHLLLEYAELGLPDDPWLGTVVSLAAALDMMELVRTILGHGIRPAVAIHTIFLDEFVEHISSQLEPDAMNFRNLYFGWRARISKYAASEANYWPLIHTAINMGNQTYLDLLLHNGYKPTSVSAHFVCKTKDIHILRRLHEHGVQMTEQVLAGTISWGDSESTDWLLSLNTDFNKPEQADFNLYQRGIRVGETALQRASRAGDMDPVDRLVRLGANINAPPSPYEGATALQAAAMRGLFGIVRKLLDLDADPSAPGAEIGGRTALEGAAEHGRLDVLQLLLNSGVETEGPGQRQYVRAIGFARRQGHCAAANLLRSHRPWTQDDQDILEEVDLLDWDQRPEEISKRQEPQVADRVECGLLSTGIDDSVTQTPPKKEDSGREGFTTDTVEVDSSTDAFEEDPYGVDVYVKEAAVSFWEPACNHLTWETL